MVHAEHGCARVIKCIMIDEKNIYQSNLARLDPLDTYVIRMVSHIGLCIIYKCISGVFKRSTNGLPYLCIIQYYLVCNFNV